MLSRWPTWNLPGCLIGTLIGAETRPDWRQRVFRFLQISFEERLGLCKQFEAHFDIMYVHCTQTHADTQAHIVLKILKKLDYIESWWVLAFTPEALSRPVVCRPWSSSIIANVITMIIVMMIYENRHEIQFTWCWASSEARSLSSVRAEQSGVATWDYLLTIGSINQCNCDGLKGLELILLRSGTQWVTRFTYWTCLASS